jgi:hypothetical protein
MRKGSIGCEMKMVTHTVIHLLGYLEPKKWADAVKTAFESAGRVSIEEVYELIRHQEETYGFDLLSDVIGLLDDEVFDKFKESVPKSEKRLDEFYKDE